VLFVLALVAWARVLRSASSAVCPAALVAGGIMGIHRLVHGTAPGFIAVDRGAADRSLLVTAVRRRRTRHGWPGRWWIWRRAAASVAGSAVVAASAAVAAVSAAAAARADR
jgi:hypothetical protein